MLLPVVALNADRQAQRRGMGTHGAGQSATPYPGCRAVRSRARAARGNGYSAARDGRRTDCRKERPIEDGPVSGRRLSSKTYCLLIQFRADPKTFYAQIIQPNAYRRKQMCPFRLEKNTDDANHTGAKLFSQCARHAIIQTGQAKM